MVIGCGTDIVETGRLRRAARKWPGSFLSKIFSQQEIEYSNRRRFPFEHLSARFAAKEAVLKAFGRGFSIMNVRDVEIVNNPSGRPEVVLRGRMEVLRRQMKIERILLSLSHTRRYAQAMVIFCDD